MAPPGGMRAAGGLTFKRIMSDSIDEEAVPRFGVGIKFRFDPTRDAWIILGPERLFLPDEHAVEVLKLVNGASTVGQIAASLAEKFDAPLPTITADIWPMLQSLAASGAIRL